jgi:hypothetical protein
MGKVSAPSAGQAEVGAEVEGVRMHVEVEWQ